MSQRVASSSSPIREWITWHVPKVGSLSSHCITMGVTLWDRLLLSLTQVCVCALYLWWPAFRSWVNLHFRLLLLLPLKTSFSSSSLCSLITPWLLAIFLLTTTTTTIPCCDRFVRYFSPSLPLSLPLDFEKRKKKTTAFLDLHLGLMMDSLERASVKVYFLSLSLSKEANRQERRSHWKSMHFCVYVLLHHDTVVW